MTKRYSPPFVITPAIIALIADIAERAGRYAAATEADAALRLRRINRIRTIRGSLAIEGNTLSEHQIIAILDGKPVIAPPREIQEVRNAIIAYERFETWDPTKEEDLLAAHGRLGGSPGGLSRWRSRCHGREHGGTHGASSQSRAGLDGRYFRLVAAVR